MTSDSDQATSPSTGSSDYGSSYYRAHLGGNDDYRWEDDEWRAFFTGAAQRIVGLVEPRTSLDVGCARGLLVQALAQEGVDARGVDISDHAVETSHPDVRNRLSVQSATEPLGGPYDLITCVEVVEHMSPGDAQKAIDNICAATDTILFSSSPSDFYEATHINVHPTQEWVAWFAERGFYRRLDADVTFLAPWAVLFERADLSKRSIVERYESRLVPALIEISEKTSALLATSRRLAEVEDSVGVRRVVDDAEVLALHADLTAIDHVLGLEATVARQERELKNLRRRLKATREKLDDARTATAKSRAEVTAVRSSRTWRVGRFVTGLGGLRR
ncbi:MULTISPECIES: class I SAM-dependent methyltransferase [unclassified Nocardioides]|jgi:SAM-dependent methyltransferase|uniref:class I SAM-dependent methyltransferase n=1 Tax=unclassified Nocardioides TaxID=2615069 RepID=UPI001151F8FE|nr:MULTISPECIES: class I SAM-dependent methyltransferase [unclassified Nocardioides]TQK72249.1 methyltransferase family protein [Nocardioides sp. SLBN-35]WGY03539.1 class I SAM-dependent methyltransferase [Nocardioides sp. QY071]